jgi:hypothetical protein
VDFPVNVPINSGIVFSSVGAVPSFRTTQNEASFLLGLTF